MSGVGERPPSRARLAALGTGQIVSWGVLFYALIVASPAIATDTGWPIALVTSAFSAGLVASAGAGLLVGRWIDERGPRLVMTLGSVVGPAGVVVVALSTNLAAFTIGWVVAGVAQAAVLYQAAFTVVARRYGDGRRGAMTILTLAGGLASTLFAPLTAGLLSVTDWRSTFLILAGLLLVTTAPLHWFSLERGWPPAPHRDGAERHTVGTVLRTRQFWMLELSTLTLVAALFGVTLALIPLLTEKGLTYELAAWGLGLLGAGQIVGRLLYVAIPRTSAPWVSLAVTAALSALSLALLALVPGPPWLLIVVGVVAGAVRGAQTLVQGSAVADRWGARSYGAINGVFAAPVTVISAVGPALGPLLAAAVGSYSSMALAAAVLAAGSVVLARFS